MLPSQCDDESKVVAALSDDDDERGRLSSCSVKCPQTHTHTHTDARTHKDCYLQQGRKSWKGVRFDTWEDSIELMWAFACIYVCVCVCVCVCV